MGTAGRRDLIWGPLAPLPLRSQLQRTGVPAPFWEKQRSGLIAGDLELGLYPGMF